MIKKSILVILLICGCCFASIAQTITTMNVFNADGTMTYIPLNTIDSVKYSVVEANAPQIVKVEVSQEEVEQGTELILHVVAQSPFPVNWLTSCLTGPNGNIYGGGSGTTFSLTNDGLYEHFRQDLISTWMPNGKYYYDCISVENEGRYTSEQWQREVSTIITTHNQDAFIPTISSVTISGTEVEGGTELAVTIVAESNAPINWLNLCLDNADGNIFGGGSGTNFVMTSEGVYEYTYTTFISQWMPNGDYVFSCISVENEAGLQSNVWTDEVKYTITTHRTGVTAPIISSVTLSQENVSNGTNLHIKVIATSEAPIDWITMCFYGPNGNIYGGGSGTNFINISEGVYEYDRTDFISDVEPSGRYYYDCISVRNMAGLESDTWTNTVDTIISR